MESLDDLNATTLEDSDDPKILGVSITVEDIQEKIKKLSDIPGPSLKTAMDDLKRALRADPEACNLLLPEEIGEMVAGIYRMTDRKMTEVKVKETMKKAKKVDLSKVDLTKLDDF